MASRRRSTQSPRPRLYLITPPIADPGAFAAELAAALDAADIAAVLLRLAGTDDKGLLEAIGKLAPAVQARGIALLLDGMPELARRAGADGAHLTGVSALKAARGILKPERIAGAGGLKTRHDAMIAGESGCDYVMFGEPDAGGRPTFAAVVERIAWWSELFEPPCIGYAASIDESAALAAAGADFVALGDLVWTGEPAAVLKAAAAAAKPAEALP
jgi:thiamine-phosphate pyrophosphorylase